MTHNGGVVFSTTLLALALFTASSQAATIKAASCSSSDVNFAISSASSGDTVQVPGGSCSWSGVSIPSTKGITVDGQGITTIASGSISVAQNGTVSSRVTGFNCAPNFVSVSGNPSSAPARVDHNVCTSSGSAIFVSTSGNSIVLIDNNSFTAKGASEMIHNLAMGPNSDSGWTNDVTPGSQNAVYIEDNTFTNTDTVYVCSAVQSYYGARTVIRHNALNFCQVDQHGTAGYIGARWWEIYENTFYPQGRNQCCYGAIRGGSGVVFNNHVSGTNTHGGAQGFQFYEEDSGTWPLAYQVGSGINGTTNAHASCTTTNNSPAYVWGNDSGIAISVGSGIQFNRDVFSSTTQPASMQRGQLSTDGCATSYKYSPYTYPFPWALTASNPPTPPVALTATVN